MIFKIFAYYIIGYINIVIEGFYIERFINKCISKKILLWNMRREKGTLLYTNISISDFKKIRKIAKDTKCSVKIKKKKGVPFLFNKYKKRKIFLGFLIFILISIFTLSNFVWNIEVKGLEKIEYSDIINTLKSSGLNTGILKGKVDTKKIIDNVRLSRDDIAWIGIKIEGTNAIVEVVEADPKPEIIDKDEYCNIISDKEAIITKINVMNGTALVKEGDVVEKDTMLVGGWMEGKYTGLRYVHATADIEAKVWYTESKKAYYKQNVKEKTGNVENKYGFSINNFKINFNKGVSKFKNYDTINENKKLILFNNFYLPIELNKTTNYEYIDKEINYNFDELKEKTISELEESLKEKITDKEVVNKNVIVEEYNDYIEVKLVYEVVENIGIQQKLVE